MRYMDLLDSLFKKSGINKYWITDTGRNGRFKARSGARECE